MAIKAFRDWKFEEVELTFGVEQVYDHALLNDWLSAMHTPSPEAQRIMEMLRDKLARAINTYNEEELKVFFMGPLFLLIPFGDGTNMRAFMDRPFSFEYQQDKAEGPSVTAGRIDWLLAKGRQDPREPRVFLHEYKREVDATGDPLGQLLIAMVGAQRQNAQSLPLYGCYVLGRNWFFVILEGSQYAVSNAFNATNDDIFRIYSALYEVQQRVIDAVPSV